MKSLLTRLGAGLAVVATPSLAFAQQVQPFDSSDVYWLRDILQPITFRSGDVSIAAIAVTILNFLILIAAVLAIFFLIWAGIQYITAGTDEDKAKGARTGIFNAIIGIVIIVLSYMIIQYVAGLARGVIQTDIPDAGGGGFGRIRQ